MGNNGFTHGKSLNKSFTHFFSMKIHIVLPRVLHDLSTEIVKIVLLTIDFTSYLFDLVAKNEI